MRDGHLHAHIGTVATLDDAIPALNPVERRKGKAVIHAHPGACRNSRSVQVS